MRAKVIVTAAVLALAILLPAIYFHYKPDSPPPAAVPPVATADDSAPPAAGPPSILKRVAQGRPQEGLARPTEAAAGMDRDTYIQERKVELIDLGMSDNPANLKIILSEMENPEPEIRQAALSATLDFGSKDAIPTLQNELNWATDPEEKVAILKAIEFLQLPSFGSGGDVTQQSDGSAPATN
jgi:hypothetical protein